MELVEFIEDAKTIQMDGHHLPNLHLSPVPSEIPCDQLAESPFAGCLAESPFHLLADEA